MKKTIALFCFILTISCTKKNAGKFGKIKLMNGNYMLVDVNFTNNIVTEIDEETFNNIIVIVSSLKMEECKTKYLPVSINVSENTSNYIVHLKYLCNTDTVRNDNLVAKKLFNMK